MSTAERAAALLDAISRAFVDNRRQQFDLTIDQRLSQEQVARVFNGLGERGGGGLPCNTPNRRRGACESCLEIYYDCEQLRGENLVKNAAGINKIRSTACSGVCVSTLDTFQKSTVTFRPSAQLAEISQDDVRQISDQVRRELNEEFGEGSFSPTNRDILTILVGDGRQVPNLVAENTATAFATQSAISQVLNTSQVIQLTGAGGGDILNASQTSMVDAVFQALAESSSGATTQTVNTSMGAIHQRLGEEFAVSFGAIFKQHFWVFIGFIILAVVCFIVWVSLIGVRATKFENSFAVI